MACVTVPSSRNKPNRNRVRRSGSDPSVSAKWAEFRNNCCGGHLCEFHRPQAEWGADDGYALAQKRLCGPVSRSPDCGAAPLPA